MSGLTLEDTLGLIPAQPVTGGAHLRLVLNGHARSWAKTNLECCRKLSFVRPGSADIVAVIELWEAGGAHRFLSQKAANRILMTRRPVGWCGKRPGDESLWPDINTKPGIVTAWGRTLSVGSIVRRGEVSAQTPSLHHLHHSSSLPVYTSVPATELVVLRTNGLLFWSTWFGFSLFILKWLNVIKCKFKIPTWQWPPQWYLCLASSLVRQELPHITRRS